MCSIHFSISSRSSLSVQVAPLTVDITFQTRPFLQATGVCFSCTNRPRNRAKKSPRHQQGPSASTPLADSLADMLRRTLRESVRSRDAVTKVIVATRVSTRSYDKKVRDSVVFILSTTRARQKTLSTDRFTRSFSQRSRVGSGSL